MRMMMMNRKFFFYVRHFSLSQLNRLRSCKLLISSLQGNSLIIFFFKWFYFATLVFIFIFEEYFLLPLMVMVISVYIFYLCFNLICEILFILIELFKIIYRKYVDIMYTPII